MSRAPVKTKYIQSVVHSFAEQTKNLFLFVCLFGGVLLCLFVIFSVLFIVLFVPFYPFLGSLDCTFFARFYVPKVGHSFVLYSFG